MSVVLMLASLAINTRIFQNITNLYIHNRELIDIEMVKEELKGLSRQWE
jgi:hypothetical protein